jgi:hypothetical protein
MAANAPKRRADVEEHSHFRNLIIHDSEIDIRHFF